MTAATYTEASTMYREAGGSSSFARHAFGEAAAEEERDADAETLVGRVTQTVMRYAHCSVVLTAAAHSELVGRLPPRRRSGRRLTEDLHEGDPPGFG